MLAVVNRLGPLAVAFFGVVVATVTNQISDRRLSAKPNDAMLQYGAFEATAFWILGTSCAVGLGWQTLRAQRSGKTTAALAYVAIWVVFGSALAIDIAYDVLGPGIDPVPRTCFEDSMDCFGEPSPHGPVLGDYGEFFLGCYVFLSTPLVLLTLLITTLRSGGADRGRAAGVELL